MLEMAQTSLGSPRSTSAEWQADDARIFPASIILALENSPRSVAFLQSSVIGPVLRAGLKYAIYRSKDAKKLLVSVHASHHRLLKQADLDNYPLQVDAARLHQADITENIELQRSGLVFDYAPVETAAVNSQQTRSKVLSVDLLGIPSAVSSNPLLPYQHMYYKFDMPGEGEQQNARSRLFRVHSYPQDPTVATQTVPFSVLRQTDAIKLLTHILFAKDDGPETGAQLQLDKLVLTKHLLNWFPAHDANCDQVVTDMKQSRFWQVPVVHIHHYFGEKVAMYFAFLEHFTQWLIWPALIGLVAFIHQSAVGYPNIVWLPAVGVFTTLWSALFIESWKRTQAKWAMQWGTSDFENSEVLRMEFCVNIETHRERSPVTGKPEYRFSPYKQIVRFLSSYSVIAVLIVMVVSVVFSIFIARVLLEHEETKGNLPKGWGSYIVSIINAIQIQILSRVYSSIAVKMTDYENHATQTAYEDALITKTCLFQFVNSYFSLFYVAFIKNRLVLFGYKQECAIGTAGVPDCMAELRSTLAIILITQIVVGNFTEVILPWILNHLGALKNRCLRKQQPVLHALESEMTLPKYDPFGDYLEMLILYGYATLFVVAFPLAPLLALGNNLIEIRVDSFKLLYNSARPVPQGAQDIGTWLTFLDVLTYLSILSNCGVVIFTDSGFAPSWTSLQRLWLFLALEHAVIVFKYIIGVVIPDVPAFVTEHLKRQDYLVRKHFMLEKDEIDELEAPDLDDDVASVLSGAGGSVALPPSYELHFHDLMPSEDTRPPSPAAVAPAKSPASSRKDQLAQPLLDRSEQL